MERFQIAKGPLECYHVHHENGKPLSVVVVRDNNITAEQMAFYLNQASAWFTQLAKEIEAKDGGRAKHTRKLPIQPAG